MKSKKITIKMWKESGTNLYVASIENFDGHNYATQGKTMKELYGMIADLLILVNEILPQPKD